MAGSHVFRAGFTRAGARARAFLSVGVGDPASCFGVRDLGVHAAVVFAPGGVGDRGGEVVAAWTGRVPQVREHPPQPAGVVMAISAPRTDLEIVRGPKPIGGFSVQPRQWVVERTNGWFNHHRRLDKGQLFDTL